MTRPRQHRLPRCAAPAPGDRQSLHQVGALPAGVVLGHLIPGTAGRRRETRLGQHPPDPVGDRTRRRACRAKGETDTGIPDSGCDLDLFLGGAGLHQGHAVGQCQRHAGVPAVGDEGPGVRECRVVRDEPGDPDVRGQLAAKVPGELIGIGLPGCHDHQHVLLGQGTHRRHHRDDRDVRDGAQDHVPGIDLLELADCSAEAVPRWRGASP